MERVYIIICQEIDTGHESVQPGAFLNLDKALERVAKVQEDFGDGDYVFTDALDLEDNYEF